MRTSLLLIGTLSALGLAIVYDQIRQATGVSITALLWVSVGALVIGLCTGLRSKNENEPETKEES